MNTQSRNNFFTDNTTDNKFSRCTKKYMIIKELPISGFYRNEIITYDQIKNICQFKDGSIMKIKLHIHNTEHFQMIEDAKYPAGIIVQYKNKMCKVLKTPTPLHDNYILKDYYGNQVYDDIAECSIKKADTYYFINTEGKICMTFIGKNKQRDTWCAITNNMFKTQEDAANYADKIK